MMDSNSQLYAAAYKVGSSSHLSDLGQSNGAHDESTMTPRSNGPASATAVTHNSTHLSGLMCNVHRTTGREPYPLVGATTTILGDKLYVFGGRILSRTRPQLTADLYELDLIRRHWTKLETTGQVPPPRYFHSVCALGDTKLVCYGGMSPPPSPSPAAAPYSPDMQPEVVVMSDIYIYDTASRVWTYIDTQDTPQGRYAHCATILPSSATFASTPLSAITNNQIDGTGGAEMVVVGGQDSANHYIEQISVFNLRSLKWTSTQSLGKSCGAYRSVVAPVSGQIGQIGKGESSSMLIYSNYNFLDVKLELQIRTADGVLSEKPMQGSFSPPGLRFPNGGVIDTNFVVSGTYLTSSKQEYALWALNLRTLTWSRIDAGGSVFSQGSWNRGVLWNRRNTFVILGNWKRNLIEDYNHRRINFSNVCMVELEAFGLYDNPRKAEPMSGFVSASSPLSAPSLNISVKAGSSGGGRPHSRAAEELGVSAMALKELADMDLLAVGGERIPVNSRMIARRWGPYFIQLLREGAATQDPTAFAQTRNSSITITPSAQTTLGSEKDLLNPPDSHALCPSSRPRTLYLPHTALTIQSMLYFLYTSSLPPILSPLCSPQILCSLLQLARPYRIDGLLEAVVERLHQILDSRNAAAVFNAAAMAAGGGRAVGGPNYPSVPTPKGDSASRTQLRITTKGMSTFSSGMTRDGLAEISEDELGSAGTTRSESESEMSASTTGTGQEREVWAGECSAVIGLQKRGLRGLMEGRRLRERGASVGRSGEERRGARES